MDVCSKRLQLPSGVSLIDGSLAPRGGSLLLPWAGAHARIHTCAHASAPLHPARSRLRLRRPSRGTRGPTAQHGRLASRVGRSAGSGSGQRGCASSPITCLPSQGLDLQPTNKFKSSGILKPWFSPNPALGAGVRKMETIATGTKCQV